MSGVGEKSGFWAPMSTNAVAAAGWWPGAHKLNADEQAEMARLCVKGQKFKYLSLQSFIMTAGVCHQSRDHGEKKTGSSWGPSHHPSRALAAGLRALLPETWSAEACSLTALVVGLLARRAEKMT